MLVEGIGVTAPQHVPIVLTANELRCLVTESGVRAEYRGYKARRDQWGKGIKSDLELPGARDFLNIAYFSKEQHDYRPKADKCDARDRRIETAQRAVDWKRRKSSRRKDVVHQLTSNQGA